MQAPLSIIELIDHFETNIDSYRSGNYNEAQLRREFVDPMLEALGWDVTNKNKFPVQYKEVVHEDSIRISGKIKAPDYAFRIGGARKFFLEAKRPSVNIKTDISPAYQLRRYAWSAKLPLSILTDFEEFAVYDCRAKPISTDRADVARIMYFSFEQYPEQWETISSLFSHSAVLDGALDKFAQDNRPQRGSSEVDDAFLKEIEAWREQLAHNIALRNPSISVRDLNTCVQRTIDRIVFLRIAEDRGIEPYGRLQSLVEGKDTYQRLGVLFRSADERYNSGLFHFRPNDDSGECPDTFTLNIRIDDKILKDILRDIYFPNSPYEFSVLPADILGQVYEQFLGKVIRLRGKSAVVEEKPAVKKAGGIYYTPTYIVRLIVAQSVGALLEGKALEQIAGSVRRDRATVPLRILDPACGSGSFLIEAYQYLLDWFHGQYTASEPDIFCKGRDPRLYRVAASEWRLTINERRRILLNHIFGVDIDAQAVEVTKLSLLLKVLEGESSDSIARQMDFFRLRALPDLASNVKCGNSLVSPDFFSSYSLPMFDDDNLLRINAFDWMQSFPFLETEKGFSVVLGNPPWISLSRKFKNDILSGDELNYLTEHYRGNTYAPNMYEYFVRKGFELTKSGGMFSFIVPDRLGYNDQFVSLRRDIVQNFRVLRLIYKAPFPKVSADTLIFLLKRTSATEDGPVQIGRYATELRTVSQSSIAANENTKFSYSETGRVGNLLDALFSNQALPNLKTVETRKAAERIIKLVEIITSLTKTLAKARVDSERVIYERQKKSSMGELNSMVAKMYGLTDDEVTLISASRAMGNATDGGVLDRVC